MWSYYGTKKKIAKHYPAPQYGKIIEPFAGAAQYSLYDDYWQRDVELIEKYDVIVQVWRYLQKASRDDILILPDMNSGDKVGNHVWLCNEERWLIGFCINQGSAQPKKTVAKYNGWNRAKVQIADNLYKIKHWTIRQGDYQDVGNQNATWFIDPPYLHGGQWYRHSNKKINYDELAVWCGERRGQVIVCENTKADWLPFSPLVDLAGQLHKTTEAVWIKQDREVVG